MNHGIILGGVVDYYYDSIKRAPGAHKIATHLRREGWNVEVLDFVQSWTLEELQEELDSLPSQDPQFLIGWLMAQVIYLKEKENEKAKRSELEMASSFKT